MFTDKVPRAQASLKKYENSDRLIHIELPSDDRLPRLARLIELAMKDEKPASIRVACAEFLAAAAEFYGVPAPGVKALSARPLRIREGGSATELFGDYTLQTATIRIWTRTAVQKRVTSYGTFLSTLCHEFCHHLDVRHFGFHATPHTRGFYERTAVLYHHAKGTPRKPLVWARMPRGRWRIDWQRTGSGSHIAAKPLAPAELSQDSQPALAVSMEKTPRQQTPRRETPRLFP